MLAELIEVPRAVLGLIFLFFVPGYALVWAIYPRREELPMDERIALAFVLSIAVDILVTLFIDLVLGIPTTGRNIFVSLLTFTALAAGVYRLEVHWQQRQKAAAALAEERG
ncbi:MAG: DUF1616 domain-containing protein [Euryarchaeota archaeon]|nr:DUF1616 domain-containing protein [Euryarchaeota archaeon]